MNKVLLLMVGCGGFIGSVARYWVQQMSVKYLSPDFPYGTLGVNLLGSFLIGLFFGLAEKGGWMNSEWRIFLVTGFCGGFTTFSSFSLESINLLQKGNFGGFGLYVILSVALCLLAGYAGILISR